MGNNILHFLSIISDTAKIDLVKEISRKNTSGNGCCDQKNKCINKEKFVMA